MQKDDGNSWISRVNGPLKFDARLALNPGSMKIWLYELARINSIKWDSDVKRIGGLTWRWSIDAPDGFFGALARGTNNDKGWMGPACAGQTDALKDECDKWSGTFVTGNRVR